jgi:RimJ/RimL family protein N-acetyltransferase
MICAPDQTASVGTAAQPELRRLAPPDREALVLMYESFEPKRACLGLPPAKNPGQWLDGLAEYPNFLLLVAGRIAGHAVLCPEGSAAEVAVFVHQDFRGRGFGRQLLRALVDQARQLGLHKVWGTTDLDNVPMLRLARSLGFVCGTDPREFYLDLDLPSLPGQEIVSAT